MVHETQISRPVEATGHHDSTKLLVFLPLRADLLCTLHYETPCRMGGNENNLALGATFNAMKMDDTTCQRPCSSPKFRGIHMLQCQSGYRWFIFDLP